MKSLAWGDARREGMGSRRDPFETAKPRVVLQDPRVEGVVQEDASTLFLQEAAQLGAIVGSV